MCLTRGVERSTDKSRVPRVRRVLPSRMEHRNTMHGQEWGTHRFLAVRRTARGEVTSGGGALSSSNPTAHLTGVGKETAPPCLLTHDTLLRALVRARTLTATLMLGLVTGLGLSAPAATPVAQAAPQVAPADRGPGDPHLGRAQRRRHHRQGPRSPAQGPGRQAQGPDRQAQGPAREAGQDRGPQGQVVEDPPDRPGEERRPGPARRRVRLRGHRPERLRLLRPGPVRLPPGRVQRACPAPRAPRRPTPGGSPRPR